MEGIHFIVDEKGHKSAVQIDLKLYGDIWEDFYDALIAQYRVDEPDIPLEEVKASLIKQGKLRG